MFESCRAHSAARAGARRLHGGNPVSPVGPLVRVHKLGGAGKAGASWVSGLLRPGPPYVASEDDAVERDEDTAG
jgi:hypothetical protein